ncbi:hypothetical protein A2U01_0075179 [Trifolium medium]|uniref:Uncharacterized protein n=1 Tax=Trifolium medium TaxID=97028 RepID=A0A392SZK5_9FABA|nr:hypothetical protein [Trifolium medium]
MADRRRSKEGARYGDGEAVLRCDDLRRRRSSELMAVLVVTGF